MKLNKTIRLFNCACLTAALLLCQSPLSGAPKEGKNQPDADGEASDNAPIAVVSEGGFEGEKITSGTAYRGGNGRTGVYPGAGVVANPAVKWKFQTGGAVFSSPVCFKGIVYVGSSANAFYALDAESGTVKWKADIKGGVDGSALIANGRVLFNSNDGWLYCLDAGSGESKWKVELKTKASKNSPAAAYGLVFTYAGRGCVMGFDIRDGKKVYETRGLQGIEAGVCLTPTREVHVEAGEGFRMYDLRTGFQVYLSPAVPSSVTTAVYLDGVIYVSSTAYCNTGPQHPSVGAYDANVTQKQGPKWVKLVEEHEPPTARMAVYSSPAVWNGRLYVGCDSGWLYTFKTDKGTPDWKAKVNGATRSSPSVSSKSKMVYTTSRDGHLYAFDAESGKEAWKLDIANKPKGKEADICIDSSVWIWKEMLFVGSADGHVYAVGGGK